jgi:hypothetical protein
VIPDPDASAVHRHVLISWRSPSTSTVRNVQIPSSGSAVDVVCVQFYQRVRPVASPLVKLARRESEGRAGKTAGVNKLDYYRENAGVARKQIKVMEFIVAGGRLAGDVNPKLVHKGSRLFHQKMMPKLRRKASYHIEGPRVFATAHRIHSYPDAHAR